MPPLRAMIDTNIVHALSTDPDTLAMVIKLLASGTVLLLITHLQGDQLSVAPAAESSPPAADSAASALSSQNRNACIIRYLAFFGTMLSKSQGPERHCVDGASCPSETMREIRHAIHAVAPCE
jgi:hypothetical protein